MSIYSILERMRLGLVLYKWRHMSEISIRDASKMIGVSPATLSRIERGEEMDGQSLSKILIWLMQKPFDANE